MTAERMNRLPASALSAFGLGVVASPLPFILRGALGQFSPAFSLVTLPPFVAAGAFLLWRNLAASAPAPPRHPSLLAMFEVVSWIVVAAFIALLSGINLLTPFERVGAVCVSISITATLFPPIVLLRRTMLERRLARLPAAATTGAALILWLAMASLAIAYLRTPSSFIGRPRRHAQPVNWLAPTRHMPSSAI